ncbi:unnamed protein product [Medioppia subpectinata]|uniref:Uncharacterized protein n=1 Tax=Medioppia subpectinata TaxID=1979941 RepID=A0A7R9KQQ4_9ACAR|nr:unnamed protein product [Medioppia subpectinata]CAG2106656.1 unnamed protein product [Medioppia subpectinata]
MLKGREGLLCGLQSPSEVNVRRDSESSSVTSPAEPLSPSLLSVALTHISFRSTIGGKYLAKHLMRLSPNIYHKWSTMPNSVEYCLQNILTQLTVKDYETNTNAMQLQTNSDVECDHKIDNKIPVTECQPKLIDFLNDPNIEDN